MVSRHGIYEELVLLLSACQLQEFLDANNLYLEGHQASVMGLYMDINVIYSVFIFILLFGCITLYNWKNRSVS